MKSKKNLDQKNTEFVLYSYISPLQSTLLRNYDHILVQKLCFFSIQTCITSLDAYYEFSNISSHY
jgi:hypothetical protein